MLDRDSTTPPSEVARVLLCAVIGAVVSGALVAFAPWEVTVLAGWIVAASCFVGRTWWRIWRLNGDETSEIALREDSSRATAHVLVNGASVVSLVGVGVTLAEASGTSGMRRVVLTAAAILTVAASWFLVQTVFTLRYAHTYYTPATGGIDFNSDDAPDYHDFAYLAFTIGMTFQVADTDLTTNRMRRLVLRHSLLAYLFGAVILAMTINVAASFIL
ncbi:MAG TPA: DUF1345 domain-containing protein [Acidimicrobiia bacterium]|nr:DUF1345 domain-containing protein [Acidimicrobiia bacterium]